MEEGGYFYKGGREGRVRGEEESREIFQEEWLIDINEVKKVR